jgi:hypothetical protein
LGAWISWQIGVGSDFAAAPEAHIVERGETQLWRFIVLFIMRLSLRTALHAIPRHRLGMWGCHGLLTLGLLGLAGSFLWILLPQYLYR